MTTAVAGTVILWVGLDTTKNPPVEISNRKQDADAGDKIMWKPAKDALAFKFSDFCPKSTPFNNVAVAHNKIECDFNPAPSTSGTKDYDYTVSVCYNKKTYTSDKAGVSGTTEGRAVIRN